MTILNDNISSELQECVNNGTISVDEVRNIIMQSKKAQIEASHPYAFTPPSKDGGRWQTFYKDIHGKRHNIRGKSKEELLEKLLPYYDNNANKAQLTLGDTVDEWLDFVKNYDSDNTVLRHKQRYAKYLQSSKLHSTALRSITSLLIEEESNRIIVEYSLTRKEWTNLKTILNGLFEYAKRKSYICSNPMHEVTIRARFRQVNKKTGKTETFNTEELADINQYLDNMYAETGEVKYMAVRLNFLLGLRVGELVALKWEDYDFDHLHIKREEIRNQAKKSYEVVPHTKTNDDRFIRLVPKAVNILQKLPHNGEFIFTDDKEQRYTATNIANVLRGYSRRTGNLHKSSHKIRKTFASMLDAAGVPLDEISSLLGHSDKKTTLAYLFNPLTDEETYERMREAL